MSRGEKESLKRYALQHRWLEERLKVLEGRRDFARRKEESLKAFSDLDEAELLKTSSTLEDLKANCEEDLQNANALVRTAEAALMRASEGVLSGCLRMRFGERAAELLESTLSFDKPDGMIQLLGDVLLHDSPEGLLGIDATWSRRRANANPLCRPALPQEKKEIEEGNIPLQLAG